MHTRPQNLTELQFVDNNFDGISTNNIHVDFELCDDKLNEWLPLPAIFWVTLPVSTMQQRPNLNGHLHRTARYTHPTHE